MLRASVTRKAGTQIDDLSVNKKPVNYIVSLSKDNIKKLSS